MRAGIHAAYLMALILVTIEANYQRHHAHQAEARQLRLQYELGRRTAIVNDAIGAVRTVIERECISRGDPP